MIRPIRTAPALVALALAVFAAAKETPPATPAANNAPAKATAAKATALPDGRALVAKAVQAMGGAEAFKKIKSIKLKAVTKAGPQEISSEAFFAGESKLFVRKRATAIGMEFTAGRNGDDIWVTRPPKPDPLRSTVSELNRALGEVGIPVSLFTLDKRYRTIETVGEEELTGRRCHRIRLSDRADVDPADAALESFMYVDAETGLPAAFDVASGRSRSRVSLGEWKKFGDLTLVTRLDISQSNAQIVTRVESYEFDTVDDAVFAVPTSLPPREPATPPAAPPAAPPAPPVPPKTGG